MGLPAPRPTPRPAWKSHHGSLKYLTLQDGDRLDEYLFDLDADLGEKSNRITSRPDDAQRLKRLLAEWENEVRAAR
jgi:hypothetical protein